MIGWFAAILGALPALISGGPDAFHQRRAALMPVTAPTHRRVEVEDDAEMARRSAERATTPE